MEEIKNIIQKNRLYEKTFSEICSEHHIEKFEQEFPKGIKAYIRKSEKKNQNKLEIVINSKLSLDEKKFAIAHELGHFFLHKNLWNKVGITPTFSRDHWQELSVEERYMEQEADDFAWELLIPQETVRRHWLEFELLGAGVQRTIEAFSRSFGLGQNIIRERLINLGYPA